MGLVEARSPGGRTCVWTGACIVAVGANKFVAARGGAHKFSKYEGANAFWGVRGEPMSKVLCALATLLLLDNCSLL